MSETQVYSMLFEQQKEANSSLLTTVYFSLGLLGGAFVSILLSQWQINNGKFREQEKKLMGEIESVEKALSTLVDSVNKKTNDLEEWVRDLYKNDQFLQAKIHNLTADKWQRAGMPQNALPEFIKESEIYLKSDPDMLGFSLNDVYECLSELNSISKRNKTALNDLMRKFPQDHENYSIVKEIKTQLQALPSEEENRLMG